MSLSGAIQLSLGTGDLPVATLTHPSGRSRCVVSVYGGQVLSWVVDGRENLFLSNEAVYERGKEIVGGIPVCWPQFGHGEPLGLHGFARKTDAWEPELLGKSDSHPLLVLVLRECEDSERVGFHHKFELRLTVELREESLLIRLAAKNTNEAEAMPFTCALHTYFAVQTGCGIEDMQLMGLKGTRFQDKNRDFAEFEEQQETITLKPGEGIDCIYRHAPDVVTLASASSMHKTSIQKTGFDDVVCWNIGETGRMDTLQEDAWNLYLCVEAAQAKDQIVLQPGEEWVGSKLLTKTF